MRVVGLNEGGSHLAGNLPATEGLWQLRPPHLVSLRRVNVNVVLLFMPRQELGPQGGQGQGPQW